jgi:hypothetical protein
MSIRGIDANLTAGKVAEQSPAASQNAKYHEMLLDKLAARAQAQEALDSTRTQSATAAEQDGINDANADGGGLGGGGSESGSHEKEKEKNPELELSLPVGAVPKNRLDISV